MEYDEDVVFVYPLEDGRWCVMPRGGNEFRCTRKAVASVRAILMAGNSGRRGRVIFFRLDGTVEYERKVESSLRWLA